MYKLWPKFTNNICQKWAKYIKEVDISFLEKLFLYFEEADMISMVMLAERTDYLDELKDHTTAFGAAFKYRVRSMLVYIVEKLGFTINYATALNIVRFDYDMLAPHIVPHIDKNMIGLMASLPHSETYVKLVPFKIRYVD